MISKNTSLNNNSSLNANKNFDLHRHPSVILLILIALAVPPYHTLFFDTFFTVGLLSQYPGEKAKKPKAIATKHYQGQIPNIVVRFFINSSLVYKEISVSFIRKP